MGHHSRVQKVVVDVPSSVRDSEVAFWRGATAAEFRAFEAYPEYEGGALPASHLWLLVQDIGDSSARIHLDVHTDDVEAEVARLAALGAVPDPGLPNPDWVVMRDPAGLPFCVVPSRPGSLDASNATYWDD